MYLGHRFDAQGIHPVKDKVQALLETRAPQNVTELKSYLGLLKYYNRFLPNLSTVLTPLHRLLQKATPWQWDEAEQQCFETTKTLITVADMLVYYNSDQPPILQCDASPYGVGAVLSHRMEGNNAYCIHLQDVEYSREELFAVGQGGCKRDVWPKEIP